MAEFKGLEKEQVFCLPVAKPGRAVGNKTEGMYL
jgi:hypothetical protein